MSVAREGAAPPVPVLVVDDNPAKRLALKAVLLPLGYDIVEADSGLAALRCVMARDFAVILLDVQMPIMDGFQTAALIRQRRQSEMTPIIFITAFGSDDLVKEDRYAEGAVDFIFAPVPPDELRAKVSVFVKLFVKAENLAKGAREVQASADQLRLLAEVAPIGIFQTDAEGRYVYTNPRWTEITGIRPHEAVGETWDTIIESERRPDLVTRGGGVAPRTDVGRRFEIQVPGPASRIVLVTAKSIPNSDGGITGWVGTLADVTAEAGVEAAMKDARDEATEASRMKSDFLANMSHEIRTPMNGVIGMTDLLLETNLDARQRDYAQAVRNSGEALLTIINDILDFSKVEAGKLEIEDIEFNVRTIVEDVTDLLAAPAQAKGLELLTVVPTAFPTVVRGDPGRVRQVLTNLVGNAIKFTQTGEIVVSVTEQEHRDGETLVRFEVSDTGDGIADEKLALIFRPFAQADSSTSRRYGGTGLGLAISSHLVSLMGGDCGLTSRLGSGSTFWFTVCVHDGVSPEARKPAPPEDGLAGATVLIADENVSQRSILARYLSDWGMVVTTVDSGEYAVAELGIAAAEGRPFAVALLDRSMPGLDGMELTKAIVVDPDVTTPLVLMTGWGQEPGIGGSGAGGGPMLSKPVHLADLRTCVRVALGLEPARTEATAEAPAPASEQRVGLLLLAEDNPVNRKIAVAMLSSVGYNVDTVLDGVAAVQAAGARQYDAILMDCQMPEMNGYEATAAIRAQEGADRYTPIVGMTAGARREDRERCLTGGMDGYLSKPVSKDALVAQVIRSVRQGRPTAVVPSDGHDDALDVTLDPAVLDELRLLPEAVRPGFLAELVELFARGTVPRLVELRAAVDNGDARAVRRLAHIVRGSSSQLGGRRLASLCARLEDDAATGALSGAAKDLDEVAKAFEELVRSLSELVLGDLRGPRCLRA